MTNRLVKKVDAYNRQNMPVWDREDYGTCKGVPAGDIVASLDEYYEGTEWGAGLRAELMAEAHKEMLKGIGKPLGCR